MSHLPFGITHSRLQRLRSARLRLMCFFCVFFLVVSNVSELLGLDSFQLSEVLTQRSMILRGEEICSPLTVEQVGVRQAF